MTTLFDILTLISLIVGLFFMLIGALGLFRFPDFYNRMHAASKCITLGIVGMLLAAIFNLAVPTPPTVMTTQSGDGAQIESVAGVSVVGAITKAILVIVFQFTAAPVAAHMLARAAHMDEVEQWSGSVGDELAEDQPIPPPPTV